MELKVEGRRPVGRPKKTWIKVVEEDMRKLNITEDMAEDRKKVEVTHITSNPRKGKLGTLNEDDDDDDDNMNRLEHYNNLLTSNSFIFSFRLSSLHWAQHT